MALGEENNGSGLAREVATYNAKLQELLLQEGKFVVIHGETVLGFWDAYLDAFAAARQAYGPLGPFLIRQIRREETTNGSLRETFKALYDAGGHGWDAVDDPEKFINELRGN
jgi:hypothetical protein